jgi:hypothetical protein
MREILREKASFSIRVLSETRFVQMDFANPFEMQLFAHQFGKGVFASRSLWRVPCGFPRLPDSTRRESQRAAMPFLLEKFAPSLPAESSRVQGFVLELLSLRLCDLHSLISPPPACADVRHSPLHRTFDQPEPTAHAAIELPSPACDARSSLLAPPGSVRGGFRSALR